MSAFIWYCYLRLGSVRPETVPVLEEVTDAEGVVLVLPVVIAVEAEAVAEVQAFVDIETYSEVHAEGAVPVAIFPGGARVAEVDGHQGAHVAEEYGAVSAQTGLDANLVGVGVVEFVGVLGGEYIPGEILVEGVFPTDVEFNLCSDAEFSAEAHAIGNVLASSFKGLRSKVLSATSTTSM